MNQKEYINPFSQVSEIYAQKLDDASMSGDIVLLEQLVCEIEKTLPDVDAASQARLYYSIGTVYSDVAQAKSLSHEKSIKKQLYAFRKSVGIIEDEEYSKEEYGPYVNPFKCLLYTNYGNTLCSCGRNIEAIAQYKKAINIYPLFGMAIGNLGRVYQDYGVMDYDDGHQDYFHYFAYSLLKMLLNAKIPTLIKQPKTVSLGQWLYILLNMLKDFCKRIWKSHSFLMKTLRKKCIENGL